jgi:hypothetical protein
MCVYIYVCVSIYIYNYKYIRILFSKVQESCSGFEVDDVLSFCSGSCFCVLMVDLEREPRILVQPVRMGICTSRVTG